MWSTHGSAPRSVARLSIHEEPHGAAGIARHYIKDRVYGANDGIITTFAVVAGVAGGALSQSAVLIVGTANLAADGLSMAVGNFLCDSRARERPRGGQPAGGRVASREACLRDVHRLCCGRIRTAHAVRVTGLARARAWPGLPPRR